MCSRKLKSRAWVAAAAFFVRSSLWRFPRGFHSILFFTQKIKGDERRAGRCRVQKLQIAMKKQAAFFFIHNEPKELEMMLPAFCPQKDVQSRSQSKLRLEPAGNTWRTQWSKLPHHTWNQVQRRRPSKRQHVNRCIFQSELRLHNKSVETEKMLRLFIKHTTWLDGANVTYFIIIAHVWHFLCILYFNET